MSEAEHRNLVEIDSEEYGADSEPSIPAEGLAELARIVEAIVFASSEPVSERLLAERLPANVDIAPVLNHLQKLYEPRGVHFVQVGNAWAFRTAPDLAFLMSREAVQQRKLSRAAMEVLAIIAYHQPVTRAERGYSRG